MLYRPGTGSLRGILLHPHKSSWIILNQSGMEIASRALRGESFEEISDGLSQAFGIANSLAREDTISFINAVRTQGYLDSPNNQLPHRIPSLTSIFLHVTDRCNLNCVHCYVKDPCQEQKQDLPSSLIKQLVDDLVELGGDSIIISGGEPLLHSDIKGILGHAASKVSVWLLTNGTLIDRDWAKLLVELNIRVQISVDGSSSDVHDRIRGPGSFERAIRAVRLLQEAGLSEKLNFSTTVMGQNVHDVANIISLAEELLVPFVRFAPVRSWGNAKKSWLHTGLSLTPSDHEFFYDTAIVRQKKSRSKIHISCGLSGFMLALPEEARDDIWCTVGKQLVVDSSGSTYPCVLLMREPFCMGNVFQNSLRSMIESKEMAELCRALVERPIKVERCASCLWRNLCQGGCMGLALEHKGTIWDTDDFCNYRQKCYREAFDRILALQEDG